ncbi:hypothetical protein BZA77DRAFT_301461 [Pyronema omphalodes]|nr:hypothetical protein BZA77DRAFT_301461 [Pyronema omphalodes]
MASADALKVEGNKWFASGDYGKADSFYTQAIIKDPTNAAYFTNRALTRVRLEQWEAVVNDCQKAIELVPQNMKAYTYLGNALLNLGRPAEAFSASQKAYGLAIEAKSPSVSAIAAACLAAKKARWELEETERMARESVLLRDTQKMYRDTMGAEEAEEKCRALEVVFGKSDEARLQRREVPDYLIDMITFGIMFDPVVTKLGQSYDRATLIDHLKRTKTDPLTKEPLTEADLRPNLALKAASEAFLKENGWAVDW